MKLVTWNCQGAFRKKYALIADLSPDLAVIQECEAADTVMLGDFNSSKRSTPRSRIGNHTTLTNALDSLWMVSAYHQYFHEKQTQEKRETFFRGRKTEKISHIDYAYIPVRWLRRLRQVEVGAPETWLAHSDHCPVIVEIHEKEKGTIV